ncbi:MAG TPA: LON peptidase substrate-binding domain-containing protein [Burkholderiales bacterium]|nr:LON peptidase substrate-binding domain-containing protein [Burkholderiales bacterium]
MAAASGHRETFIFPLNTVLFPGGVLPLKIFEQRYIEMTKICLRDNLPFGVCQIREGREVGTPALPETVGCFATITQWDMPQLGLFHLVVRGNGRFRIVDTQVAANGLISGQTEPLPPDSGPAEMDETCCEVLRLVIDKAGAANFPAPVRLDDPAWVAYRLAEILPVGAAVKQQVLELQDTEARFSLLRRIMAEQGLI